MGRREVNRLSNAATPRLIERLALVGVTADDSEDVRALKATLTLAASTVTVLAVVWVATYLTLGLPLSAAIPLAYQIVSITGLGVFAWTKGYRFFRFSQLVLMTVLPFLLQWSLGGYVASSAVSLWALVAVFASLFFYSARAAVAWFVVFIGLTALSGLIDPMLSLHAAAIPDVLRTEFFVLNVTGVSFTAFLLLQYFVRAREAARARSERLLLNVLPRVIAERLKREEGVIADAFDDVTVLFADIAGFTPFAEGTSPDRVAGVLDEIFSSFDALAQRHGLEKIKTIGDAYMAVGGLPEPRPDHAEAIADLSLEMLAEFSRICAEQGLDLSLRIGMHSGPVIAGVIGRSKFIYDLWGDTVNTAARMESQGLPGRVQVTEAIYQRLRNRYLFEERAEIDIKGKGRQRVYVLLGRLAGSASPATKSRASIT